jgi:hypothetical protein
VSSRSAVVAALLLFVPIAGGAEPPPYEVTIAGVWCDHSVITAPIAVGLDRLRADGTVAGSQRKVEEIVPGPNRTIFGITRSNEIVRAGRAMQFDPLPASHRAEALTVAADGTVYVLVSVAGGNNAIDVFDRDGSFRTTHSLADADYAVYFGVELGPDQCSLYLFGNSMAIRRFDVCSGTFAGDIAVPVYGEFRLLPDGGFLIAANMQLVRVDAGGNHIRTWSHQSWVWSIDAIALSDEGRTAWVTGSAEEGMTVDAVDVESGRRLQAIRHDHCAPTSLVPWNSWTAAIGDAAFHTEQVPAVSHYALTALAALLVFAALRRIG